MVLSPAPAPRRGRLIHWTKLHTPALLLGVKWHQRSRHWAWYQLVQPPPLLSSKQGHRLLTHRKPGWVFFQTPESKGFQGLGQEDGEQQLQNTPSSRTVSLKIRTKEVFSAEKAFNLSGAVPSPFHGTFFRLEEIGRAGVSGLIEKQAMHSSDREETRTSVPPCSLHQASSTASAIYGSHTAVCGVIPLLRNSGS